MSVVARFYVSQFIKSAGMPEGAGQVHLNAVCRGPENADWAKWSPSGTFQMSVNNPRAAAWFESRLGKDIAITFEERDPICEKCHQEAPEGTHWFDNDGAAHWSHTEGACPS